MSLIRTYKAAVLVFALSAALYAQHDKPSKPSAPSHSAPSHSAPSHEAAPARSAPSHESAPSHAAPPSRPMNTPSQPHSSGNSAPVHQNPSGSTTIHPTPAGNASPSPGYGGTRGPVGNNAPSGNNGSNRGASPNGGNNRPGGSTTYGGSNNGNNRPGGNVSSPNNGNNRPGGNVSSPNNGNNRPGGSTVYGGGNRGGSPNNGGFNRPGSNGGNVGHSSYPAKAAIYHAPGGGQVQTRSDGSIREVRTSGGAVIHHAPDGVRRVEMQRPGGRVVVASGHGMGYVQRPLVVSNRTYIQRTYVVHGVSYARVYRPWAYGGVSFHVYTPMRFWSPGFYSYAYSPWSRPIAYGWGWGGSPWYGYYGGWFTPYPTYASPAFWLTDYLIARTLEDAYDARRDAAMAAQSNYGATPLTPDVKQAVADEVRRQLDQERAEQQSQNSMASSGPPPIFSGNGSHVFVVSSALDVDAGGQMCAVSEGDVLQLNSPPPPNSQAAQVVVLASKGNDCRKGSMVMVGLQDLQEMQNQMRATIDQGLGDLQSKQGQGGLPSLPASAAGQPTNASFAAQAQPDANVAAELTQATQEADRAEQDTVNQTGSGSAPLTVSLGQSINEVEAIMGKPRDIADAGAKKIYVYKDLKIIFMNGKVSDIQ